MRAQPDPFPPMPSPEHLARLRELADAADRGETIDVTGLSDQELLALILGETPSERPS